MKKLFEGLHGDAFRELTVTIFFDTTTHLLTLFFSKLMKCACQAGLDNHDELPYEFEVRGALRLRLEAIRFIIEVLG